MADNDFNEAINIAKKFKGFFRITDGARLLAGKEIRVGVVERGGNARLNKVLYIPPFIDLDDEIDLISSGSQ